METYLEKDLMEYLVDKIQQNCHKDAQRTKGRYEKIQDDNV